MDLGWRLREGCVRWNILKIKSSIFATMGLLDDITKMLPEELQFQERYEDMEGAQEGYDRKEWKQLKSKIDGGVTLSASEQQRWDYLDTIRSERTRAATTLGTAAVGTVAGAYTGNTALMGSSLGMGAEYLGEEKAELEGPNDGTGQQLQTEDFTKLVGPLSQTVSSLGHSAKTGRKLNYASGGKMELRNRYNPRKHDYIKGNTFGFGLKK